MLQYSGPRNTPACAGRWLWTAVICCATRSATCWGATAGWSQRRSAPRSSAARSLIVGGTDRALRACRDQSQPRGRLWVLSCRAFRRRRWRRSPVMGVDAAHPARAAQGRVFGLRTDKARSGWLADVADCPVWPCTTLGTLGLGLAWGRWQGPADCALGWCGRRWRRRGERYGRAGQSPRAGFGDPVDAGALCAGTRRPPPARMARRIP